MCDKNVYTLYTCRSEHKERHVSDRSATSGRSHQTPSSPLQLAAYPTIVTCLTIKILSIFSLCEIFLAGQRPRTTISQGVWRLYRGGYRQDLRTRWFSLPRSNNTSGIRKNRSSFKGCICIALELNNWCRCLPHEATNPWVQDHDYLYFVFTNRGAMASTRRQ